MQAEFAIPRPPATSVRKQRLLMLFDSKDSAYRWADKNAPSRVRGALGFCPPVATHDREAGGWVLRYTVQMGGHVRYLVLARNRQLVKV